MATLIAKTYETPTIGTIRATCIGMQYEVFTRKYRDIVTVSGEQVTCTCGERGCQHIGAVEIRLARNTEADRRREAYCQEFSIYA